MRLAAIAGLLTMAPAVAQQRPFTGPSAGVEAGYLEHHFTLTFEEFDPDGQRTYRQSEYQRAHGVGGGAFAGYDIAPSTHWRLSVEVAAAAGGATSRYSEGPRSIALAPRFGVRGTVRAGYVLTPRLMGYGSVGYGGNEYRVLDTLRVEGSDELSWGSSFIVGAGAEYRINRRFGIRLDGKHVDNQTWQLFVGVPIRF